MLGCGLKKGAVEAAVGVFVCGQQILKAGAQLFVSVTGLIEIRISCRFGIDLPSNVKDGVFV
jgi:hypothetical protein